MEGLRELVATGGAYSHLGSLAARVRLPHEPDVVVEGLEPRRRVLFIII